MGVCETIRRAEASHTGCQMDIMVLTELMADELVRTVRQLRCTRPCSVKLPISIALSHRCSLQRPLETC